MKQKWFRSLLRYRLLIIVFLVIQFLFILFLIIKNSQIFKIANNILMIISLFVSLYVISKNDKGAYKLSWVFLILVFPIFGGLFYIIFNFQSSGRRFEKRIKKIENRTQNLSLLPGSAYEEAEKKIPDKIAQLRYLEKFSGFPVYKDSKVKYLSPGEKKFECLLSELEKAEKYIFLEYFIIQEGVMWDSILEILKRKVKEGVTVRIIYDDFGCFFLLPKNYPKRLKEYGIEAIIFNPFRPLLSTLQNNRDHRKIVSIDGKIAFTGGNNLADEYINAIEKHGHWKDASIMVEGKAAWSFTLMFLQMWELCTGVDEDYCKYYPWKDINCPIESDGFVLPYSDSPMDKENVGEHVYLQIINNAKEYVYINTPYLIIDDEIMSALCLAAKSGVDVRIVTPHKWDKWFVHMTTRSYYRELINSGVKIYEYTNGFIHSKTFVSDDTVSTVGTVNLDYRSMYLHFECGVLLFENSAISEIKKDFLDTLDICHPITNRECKCNIFVKVFQDIMRLFAPLM